MKGVKRAAMIVMLGTCLVATAVGAEKEKEKKTGLASEAPSLIPRSSRLGNDPRRERILRIMAQNWHYDWDVDESKPITLLEVSLSRQELRVFQGDRVAGSGPVSTGREGFSTSPGSFKVLEKDKDHKSSLYGEWLDKNGKIVNQNADVGDPVPPGLTYQASPMSFFLRLTDAGTGLHAGFLPGYAASHGCIRLPTGFAEKLFGAATVGTTVEIVP